MPSRARKQSNNPDERIEVDFLREKCARLEGEVASLRIRLGEAMLLNPDVKELRENLERAKWLGKARPQPFESGVDYEDEFFFLLLLKVNP